MPWREGISTPTQPSSPASGCQRAAMLNLQSPGINSALLGLAGGLHAQSRQGHCLAPERIRQDQKPLQTPLSCQSNNSQFESWKLNGNLLLQWCQGMQGMGNCAEARNPTAFGQTMNSKYKKKKTKQKAYFNLRLFGKVIKKGCCAFLPADIMCTTTISLLLQAGDPEGGDLIPPSITLLWTSSGTAADFFIDGNWD